MDPPPFRDVWIYTTVMIATLAALILVPQGPLTLASSNGGRVNPFADGKRSTVLFFLTEECPISRKFSPEMARIASDYASRKVRFYAVHVDPTMTAAKAKAHARSFSLPFPALLDPYHLAVTKADVKIVPTAAVYDARGRLRYIGRIDDRFPYLGAQRSKPRRQDLRLALDAVLAGKQVAVPKTDAVGCTLPPAKE